MRLEALMVKLIPDNKKIIETKSFQSEKAVFLDLKNYSKELYLGSEYREECFITKSHFNIDGDGYYYIPAFKILDLDEMDSSKNYTVKYSPKKDEEETDLYYDEIYDVFYDKPAIKIKNSKWNYCNDVAKASGGSINAGSFYLNVYEKSKKLRINRVPYKMCVLPSSMSIEQYEIMINDLLNIEHELLLEEKSGAKQSIQVKWEKSLEEIQNVINSIQNALILIDKNPKVRLYKELDKVEAKKIRKFNSKTIVEMAINKGAKKYTAFTQKEDTDIYENQIMLYSIDSLKSYINHFNCYISQKIYDKKQIIEKEKQKMMNLYNIDDLNHLKDILIKNDKGLFYDLMIAGKRVKEENREKLVRVKIPIYKYMHNEGDYGINFGGGKLHTTIESKGYENGYYSIDYNKKSYDLIEKGTIKSINIHGRKVSLDLDVCDERQHLLLYNTIYNNKSKNIIIDAIVEANGYHSEDILRGKQVCRNGKPYHDTYEYNIKIVNIISINGITINNFDNVSSLKAFFIKKGLILNKDLIINQIQMLNDKQLNIEKEISTVNNRYAKIKKMSCDLDKILNLKFFKNVSKKKSQWKLTQIFTNDVNYSKVYNELYKLDKKLKFTTRYNSKDIIHKKADRLYEYWMLIKMLQILISEQHWKIEGENSISALVKKFLIYNGKLEDICINLFHDGYEKNSKIKMVIFYNKRFSNKKTPDFAFKIIDERTDENEKIEKWFYLDAKYRDYDSMGRNEWYNDINTVAINKYINSFKNTETEATASFIAHSDAKEKYVYFGGYFDKELSERLSTYSEDNPKHRFGSFYFVPGKTEHFKTFIKLILEYHFMKENIWQICWDCGSINTKIEAKSTRGKNIKYYVTCKDCNSFWVRNHCEEEGHELVKHGIGNYHKETSEGDPWYVKCPQCDYIRYKVDKKQLF